MSYDRHRQKIRALAAIFFFVSACSPVPDGVSMWVESPGRVNLGEPFTFLAHIKNESEEGVVLHSLDIGDSYLSGVSIARSEPMFSELEHIPIDNTVEHSFEIHIPPGEHLVVTFHAEATAPGVQQGDFDFCVNSLVNCEFQTITTSIQRAP
jgi:hypothetical protein